MTHRVQPIRSKIEDLPLSASIECLDPPEQSQFSTHTTDLLSNIHHNIYSTKMQKNFGSPEIESQFGTQSIQQIMSGIQTPSNLDSISREIQIPQSITAIHSLQATHSRHNSKDFFLTTGHSPSKNFYNTEKVINTNVSKLDSFNSTLPVRNLRDIDTEKDYESENILKERRTENARKTVSYKNFGIKHDDDQKPLNITPLGQPDLNQVDEAEQTQETEETERRNHHSLPTRSEGFSRIEKRALSKNPIIGKMINESSKELDRINKMLENHRQKNATKKMFQDTIENSYAQRNSEKFHPSEIRPMDEGQSGPSEIYLQTDGQENSLENMMAGPQELEPKYTEQLSGDFFTDRLEDHFYKDDIENVLEGELEEEQLERELGLDDLESRRHDDLMMMEEEMIFNKEEKMMKGGKKKMNKLQKDFEIYRASNPPKGTRMTATADHNNKHYMNKISMQNKRHGQGKVSKENHAPPPVLNLKQATKKNPPQGFHSIDMSNQSIEHPSKKTNANNKAMNNQSKDKGSYAKKFLEYKERRKQQNQLPRQTETIHPEGTPQKSSRSSNSERKTQQQRLTYNNREDSLPLTDRSSARKRNLNTPQASARQRSRTQGPNQNAQETKNIQLMRYCDIRNAHKSNQKQAPAVGQRDSIQPINRLELDRLRENREDDRKTSSRAANPAVVTTNGNGNGNSVSANLIKPILVISDHKNRRPSIERAQTFRDNNDLVARAGKKEVEMDIPDYQKEILRGQPINPEEIMRETHQIYSSASSTKNSRVTQESLMKSLKLRQEMFSKAFGGGKNLNPRRGGSGQIDFKDYESHGRIGAVGDLGLTAPLMREKRRDEEIYNKNIEWLNSRQRKLNKMHNKEMEDEMRECTFKPQLLTKELNLKLEYESEINLPRSRERNNQGSFSRNIPV